MAKATVELVGLDDLYALMKELPVKYQRTIGLAALKEASKPLIKEEQQALSSVPHGSKYIGNIKAKSRRIKGRPGVEVGYYAPERRDRKKRYKVPSYKIGGKTVKGIVSGLGVEGNALETMVGWWNEFGTMERMTKPREPKTRPLAEAQRRAGDPPRGRWTAHGWMRRVMDTKMTVPGPIADEFKRVLWKKTNAFLKRNPQFKDLHLR